jgi:ABC-type lipoprotein export system ATPase subunit
MSELIRLQNIHKAYWMGPDRVPVLRGIDLAVKQGEFVAIMGASGSGKSTLLHIAGALDTPDPAPRPPRDPAAPPPPPGSPAVPVPAAEVFFKGEPLSTMGRAGRDALRKSEFGFVFQFYHLLPELNVLENVLLPSLVERTPRWLLYALVLPFAGLALVGLILGVIMWIAASPLGFFIAEILTLAAVGALALVGIATFLRHFYMLFIRKNPRKQEALALLESFGLKERLRHRPGQLSGGERQRVAIARALINAPALLLADEPTGNLDAKTGRTILDVLLKLHREKGQTILLVTHDPNVAALADRTVHLADGRIKT